MASMDSGKTNRAVVRPRDLFGSLRDEMDRVFDQFGKGWSGGLPSAFSGHGGGMVAPQFDVRDDGAAVTIEVELPGVDEKDVAVTVSDGILTVKGEKKQECEEKGDSYYISERAFGSFQRALRLPDWVDETKVEAHFDKGVLKIVAPKKPEAVTAERQIEIKTPRA